MRFEWDAAKAGANLAKHGVSFELAREVWDDASRIITYDRYEDGEERWHATGRARNVTLIVAVHSYPVADDEAVVRIIGARRATRSERWRYEREGA